jgi:Ni,Fe-hydrogenase III small subunit
MLLFTKIWKTGLATEILQAGDPRAMEIGRALEHRIARLLGRALAIREVDAGSCNGCEIEIAGLASPVYDMERFGMHFVASPRHADLLLVTGPVTRNMEIPLRRTYEATPDPKLVVAVGDCARTCGVFKDSYAIIGPVDRVIPVDTYVAGCPPEPTDILRGILYTLGRLDGSTGVRPAPHLRAAQAPRTDRPVR